MLIGWLDRWAIDALVEPYRLAVDDGIGVFDDEIKAVDSQTQGEVFGASGINVPFGRICQMRSGGFEFVQIDGGIRRVAQKQRPDVFGAEGVLVRWPKAGFAHGDDADGFWGFGADIIGDGPGVHKARGDDGVGGGFCSVEALGAGAGGVDEGFAGQVRVADVGGRVAEIGAGGDGPAPLPDKQPIGMAVFEF